MKKLICLLLTLLSLDVMAQITTASLRGVVQNLSKEALVGATVSLTQSKTGVAYYFVVDRDGRFAIHGIKPDDGYKLEVSYLGYDNYCISDLTLRVGESRSIDVVMRENLASVGAVVVEADNVKSAGVVENYSREVIESLPSVSRSLYDVVRLTPQANATKGGGMSYGGVANRYNSFMVNGIANNDMYGLSSSGTNGGLSNANPVSLDAIAQIEVAVASYDVRMSGFSGGMINAVTKSGTNEFAGSAYSYFNNQDLYGTTPGRNVANREKLQQQTNQIYGVTFGGPIVKDKVFFFVSGEYNEKSSPSSHYWGFDGAVLLEDELQRISSRYESLTGYDGGGVGRRDVKQRSGSLLANIDWRINSRNRLSASYSYLDARAEEYANTLS
ncbi:MAG: TonB-dependent receptor, partial [Alistipes sp.]|nr:TonB-dependent receptor [Alistipes sp.]